MADINPLASPLSIPHRLPEILRDKGLAKLGDAYVNFLYSYALSYVGGAPTGGRVSDQILFNVARGTGLRRLLPHRTRKGRIADAVESLIAYAWLKGVMSFERMASISINSPRGFEGTLMTVVKTVLGNFEE